MTTIIDELEGVASDLQSSGWARAPACVATLKRVMKALAARPTVPELEAAVERVTEATAFMEQAGAMLGRGEMPAPATPYAVKWHAAHATLLHALAEANERASLLQTAVHERCAERDEALKECARYAREAGFATGKLEMSEAAGIVDGWKERAEAAEFALAASEARRGELEGERDEATASFDLRWKSDMRAIKRWHEAGGDPLTWPDHTDLSVWLMGRLTEYDRAITKIARAVTKMDRETVTASDQGEAVARDCKPVFEGLGMINEGDGWEFCDHQSALNPQQEGSRDHG